MRNCSLPAGWLLPQMARVPFSFTAGVRDARALFFHWHLWEHPLSQAGARPGTERVCFLRRHTHPRGEPGQESPRLTASAIPVLSATLQPRPREREEQGRAWPLCLPWALTVLGHGAPLQYFLQVEPPGLRGGTTTTASISTRAAAQEGPRTQGSVCAAPALPDTATSVCAGAGRPAQLWPLLPQPPLAASCAVFFPGW